ncbi:hypothetical protein A5844_000817 [Enterococcus sp. 10A9_DIV0425]|uniref:HTH merR-type domain-containing protein n=1 Tax=Candidatus Enterococcus wittei TaxID=1987383 RepID=A0A2C9XT46_9ENTE|nr:MerR family transcriptional regulator [Enterococcus sp. 10A9_DIV0425]OTP12584.1 hypothetical protein A5844_000817 [Enterococcus sp. 10A9_DIV0425]THE15606.1 MerR family transcriptional regulator [Enterococcus hirae]
MKRLYTIGEVSELLNIPSSTIRYWDAEGLIKTTRHEENDYRLFDIDDIYQIYDINFYRNLNIPLKQMKNLYKKTLTEFYETLAETEERLITEQNLLKKKLEEIHARKEQLKRMIDSENTGFQKEKIPFEAIVVMDSEDILSSKEYLKNSSSFAIVWDRKISEEPLYGFFIEKKNKIIPSSKKVWQNDRKVTYIRFLLKVESNNLTNNNLHEVKEKLEKQGYLTGKVVGQYLLTNVTERGEYFEYYHAWIEVKAHNEKESGKKR